MIRNLVGFCAIVVLLEFLVHAELQTAQQSAMLHCPKGYDMKEKDICIRQVVSPPVETCQAGELIAPQKCFWRTSPTMKCPPGFQNSNEYHLEHHHHYGGDPGQCTSVEVVPMIPACPENALLFDNICVNVQKAFMQMVCPIAKSDNNIHNQGTKCVEFNSVSPLQYCADGSPLENGFCIGKQMGPCPKKANAASTSTNGGAFSRLFSRQKENNESLKLCERPVNVTPDLKCPEGTLETHGRHGHGKKLGCVAPHEVALVPVCPFAEGVISEDGTYCTLSTPVETLASCPPGFSECTKRGLHHFSGRCCKVSVAIPLLVCLSSFELVDGNCVTYTGSVMTCDGNAVLANGKCISEETISATVEYISTKAASTHTKY